MKRDVETCFNYCDNQSPARQAYFSSDEQRWINKIRKLAQQYPSDCVILKQPEDNDGCIYCKLPPKWLRIQPPSKTGMSEEQRQASRERMKRLNKMKHT